MRVTVGTRLGPYEVLGSLGPDNHGFAVALAKLPDEIRGFGHVKERNLKKTKAREAELLALLRQPRAKATAAE